MTPEVAARRSVQRDPGACALWAYRDDATWLLPSSGEALRLDHVVLAAGTRSIVALDQSQRVVVIDRVTGMRSPVASELHRVSLAPHSEMLLLQGEPSEESTALDLRSPEGRVRRVTNRARPETAWSNDGRWLVYVSGAKTDACGDVHLVDTTSGVDRVATPICHLAGWVIRRRRVTRPRKGPTSSSACTRASWWSC